MFRHPHTRVRSTPVAAVALALLFLLSGSVSAAAQSYPPSWGSTTHYAVGDVVQTGGNWYRAIKAITTPNHNPATDYADWELNFVRSNTTLMIGTGETFPTLVAAWTYALNSRVADGSYLHFYISTTNAKHTESLAAPFLLDHSCGTRMAILGDNESNITFNFNFTNGLIIDTGHSFNTLSGFNIANTGAGNTNDGIKVDLQASIDAVENLTVNGFSNGIHVSQNGSISIYGSCSFSHAGSNVCLAESCGAILFPQAFSLSDDEPGSGIALNAAYGGIIVASVSMSIQGYDIGIQAYEGGVAHIVAPNVQTCFNGCVASGRGVVDLLGGSFSQNTNYDLEATLGGFIAINSTTYSSSLANFSTDGSYIAT
jgi:hypothetical protein